MHTWMGNVNHITQIANMLHQLCVYMRSSCVGKANEWLIACTDCVYNHSQQDAAGRTKQSSQAARAPNSSRLCVLAYMHGLVTLA